MGDHNIATDPKLDRFPERFVQDQGGKEFLEILETFDLRDACRVMYSTEKIFTFKRAFSKSRIDKILVSSMVKVVGYEQEDTGFSDHEIIWTTIEYKPNQVLGPGVWRNNTKYYAEKEFITIFKELWVKHQYSYERKKNLQVWWVNFKYIFRRSSIKYAKEKALQRKRDTQMRQNGLQNLSLLLCQNPTSKVLLRQYEILKTEICNEKIKHIKEKIFKEEAEYLAIGDKPTKAFFDKYKNKSSGVHIKELLNKDGVKISDVKGMLGIAHSFYKGIYIGEGSNIQ